MRRGTRHYTVVFIPDNQRRTFTLKVPAAVVTTLVALVVMFLAGTGVLMFRAGTIAVQLQLVQYLKQENRRLREESERLAEIRRKVEALERMNSYFERLFTSGAEMEAQLAGHRRGVAGARRSSDDDSVDELTPGTTAVAQAREGVSVQRQYTERVLLSVPFIRPVQGWITRAFVQTAGSASEQHQGVDFAAAEGTPIRATAPGVVEEVVYDEYLGKTVSVRHQSGFATRYAHCAQVLVSKGEHVERGQTLATVGSTGRSTGPHLHYEVVRNGRQADPLLYVVDQ